MDTRLVGHSGLCMSLNTYVSDLRKTGLRVLPRKTGNFWARFNPGFFTRIPMFHLAPPSSKEVQQVLWRGPAMVASYLMEPDERHPANTWLYLCTDQDYRLEKLAPRMRTDARRALRELRITPLTYDELLAHGAQAFCETRQRVGLSDGTLEEFHARFTARRLPEMVLFGAWRGDQLAGFLSAIQVDDWAEIIGNFSANALRGYRPSDGLFYSALSYYLVKRKCRLVYVGMSSIQDGHQTDGLHKFKMKIGCEARPVHRAFVLHPLLRPLVNRVTLWGVNKLLQLKPGDKRLQKARGVLNSLLGTPSLLEKAHQEEKE